MKAASVLTISVRALCIAAAGFVPLASIASAPERNFDFWIGDWKVAYPGMPGNASSHVYLSADKCILVESWDGGKGHKGDNVFAYSSEERKWHGMFTDNEGRVHLFEGDVKPNFAEFTGPSKGPNGEAVLNRVDITEQSAGKVEQIWQKSEDSGKTWRVEFRGEYSRER